MASKEASVLRDLTDESLVDELDNAKKELFNLRFRHVTGQLDNAAALRVTRRQVARILTELREREIAAAEALEAEMTSAGASAASEEAETDG